MARLNLPATLCALVASGLAACSGTTHEAAAIPAAVADLKASASASGAQIALTWTAPASNDGSLPAAAYALRFMEGACAASFDFANAHPIAGVPAPSAAGTAQTFSVTGLAPRAAYCFAIESANAGQAWSAASNLASATTGDASAPAAVALNSGLPIYDAASASWSVQLDWLAPGDDGDTPGAVAPRYQLWQLTSADGTCPAALASSAGVVNSQFAAAATDSEGAPSSHTVSGLQSSTTYCFGLSGEDAAGNVAAQSASLAVSVGAPIDTTPPDALTLSAALPAAPGGAIAALTLQWNAPDPHDLSAGAAASSYQLVSSVGACPAASSAAAATGLPVPAAPGTAQSFAVAGLLPATGYCFEMRSIDSAGNVSAPATVFATTLADTIAPAAFNATLVSTTSSSITVRWTEPADDDGSRVADILVYAPAAASPCNASALSGVGPSLWPSSPAAPGATETLVLQNLSPATSYCRAFAVADRAGNVSTPSFVSATTLAAPADAGTDAGTDGGTDAGADAGTDAGTNVDAGTDAGTNSGEAGLASLAINAGSLSPAFATATTSYVWVIPSGATTLTLTPAVSFAGDTIAISQDGNAAQTISSGAVWSSSAIPSPGGTSSIAVNVTGPDSSTRIYQLTVTTAPANAEYNLQGFASATTGGGQLAVTDPAYAQVTTTQQLIDALYSFYKGAAYGAYTKPVQVIEIMNDLNVGYVEQASVAASTSGHSIYSSGATPKLHPGLIAAGVSVIDIQSTSKSPKGLTIFSANGATIRHGTFNIKSVSNVIVRNLKFDELWEWDEQTKGNYDENDWDFIDLGNGGSVTNVWIDHCTFTKSYDGIVDIKAGVVNVTFSWNTYVGDDGATNPNSWVRQQFNALETSQASYPMYSFLRTRGFSIDDLVQINQGHDKTHLLGQNDLDPNNATLRVTFHHEWYQNVWDRAPARLRAGDVHVFNAWMDDTVGLQARTLRDTRAAAMSAADQVKLNGSSTADATYHMGVFLNGTISTEDGAALVQNSIYTDVIYPLRNNQTDPSNPEYTGKILATGSSYHMDALDGHTPLDFFGNSTDPGSPMGPFEAPVIAFSWNGFTDLPYSAVVDETNAVEALLQAGAGAGKLTWTKDNWLKTSY